MSFPVGASLRSEVEFVTRRDMERRLAATTFESHINPVRAARATLSLRTAYPWLSPSLVSKMGAFGVRPDDPEVAQIAGLALGRSTRRGGDDTTGQRRRAAEVRNVMARPATPDYLRASGADAPVTAQDLGMAGLGQDYSNAIARRTRTTAGQRGRIARRQPGELAELHPELAERFATQRSTFDAAREIQQNPDAVSEFQLQQQGQGSNLEPGTLGYDLGYRREGGGLVSPSQPRYGGLSDQSMAAARQLATQLPGFDATIRHIRHGGVTFRGIPLPGGSVGAGDLAVVYDGTGHDDIARTLRWKRGELEQRYENPGDMPREVRAVYEGIVAALDEHIEPSVQSLGPDLQVAGVSANFGDLVTVPYSAAKTAVRTATMAMDGIWQSGQAAFRQVVSDPTDIHGYAGFSPLALAASATDTQFGTPGGDLAQPTLGQTDIGITLERLANGQSAGGGQGFFVSPDTPVAVTRREREAQYGLIGGHVITMGRYAADRIGLEPDTLPFEVASGIVDLGWQLVEPGGAAVDMIARAPASSRLLAAAGGFAETRSLHADRFDDFLRGSSARAAIQHYADLDSPQAVARSWEAMSNRGAAARMPVWAHYALADGDVGDVEYVEEMLRNFTGMGYHTPGVALREGLAPGVAWRRRLADSRLFGSDVPEAGRQAIDRRRVDTAVTSLVESARNARVPREIIDDNIHRLLTEGVQIPTRPLVQRFERQLADLPAEGTVLWRGEDVPVEEVRAGLQDSIDELLPGIFINQPQFRQGVLVEVWNNLQDAKRDRLMSVGVPEAQADKLTHLSDVGRRLDRGWASEHERMGAYFMRLATDDSRDGAVNRRIYGIIDGTPMVDMSAPTFAHAAAEHLSRYLPLEADYRQMARLSREIPHKVALQWLSDMDTGQLYRPWQGLDGFMSKVWKPSRILRPAYISRVVLEEQGRIGASGYDSMFTHLISHFAIVMGTRPEGRLHRFLDATTGGRADDFGRLVTDAEGVPFQSVNPYEAAGEFRQVLNRAMGSDRLFHTGGFANGGFDPMPYITRGGSPDQWDPGTDRAWADLFGRLHSSDEFRAVAQMLSGDHGRFGTLAEIADAGGPTVRNADDLRLMDPKGTNATIRNVRADLAESHPEYLQRGEATWAARYAANDPDETIYNWDDFIESVEVRINEVTGGNEDLLHVMARGKFPDGVAINNPSTAKINPRAARRLREDYAEFVPEVVPGDSAYYLRASGDKEHETRGVAGSWADQAIEIGFRLIGAIPTDRYSRSPAYRQFHVRRMQDLLPHMTAKDQAKFLTTAEELMRVPQHGWHVRLSAYMNDLETAASPTMASLRRAASEGTGDLSVASANEMAHWAALDNTRALLYDVHKKGQFMDAMRIFFPFGEAWKEVMTRWVSILGQRPGTVLQRANQLAGATGGVQPWKDIVEDPSHHGWLYTDSNGQTLFTYPGTGWLTGATTGVPTEMAGSMNGLSIMSSVLPGVGPVLQFPAAASTTFRESPEFDAVREALFPFGVGADPFRETSDYITDLVLPPAAQRVIQGSVVAITGHSAEEDTAFMSTLGDVMRYNVSTGDYTTDNPDAIDRLTRDSIRDAGLLTLIRGLAGMTLPSAPIPQFQVRGNDGQLLMLRALRDAYFDLQEEDFRTATPRFMELYGDRMTLVMQSTSVPNTAAVPVTEEADRWVREHPEVRGRYPTTFGLWAPGNVDGEFDIEAWGRNIRDRAVQVMGRELSPQDFIHLANDRVASSIYRETEAGMLARPDAVTASGSLTGEAEDYLRGVRQELESRFPGFNSDGLPHGPTPGDLQLAIGQPGDESEVRNALDDDLIPRPLRDAVRTYLEVHDQANTVWAPEAGATSYYSSAGTEDIRRYLRYTVAPGIRADLPDRFRAEWDNIFDRLFDRIMIQPAEDPTADELRPAA